MRPIKQKHFNVEGQRSRIPILEY